MGGANKTVRLRDDDVVDDDSGVWIVQLEESWTVGVLLVKFSNKVSMQACMQSFFFGPPFQHAKVSARLIAVEDTGMMHQTQSGPLSRPASS
jgi:hypothetical protein